jgi:hypothetical protein
MNESRAISRFLPLVEFGLALISLTCFALPMYVIRPFRHQGATELAVALFIKQIAPWLSEACLVIGLTIAILSWPRIRGWMARSAVVVAVLLASAGAYLSRLNVYELMFHPIGSPQFQSAKDAHIDKDDTLIVVRLGDVSRAYPVREMAYHHVVNDTVAGEPIVSTY